MIYLFDTSGINHLHDDPDCEAIVHNLIVTNEVYVSALNVAEVVGTANPRRRKSLLLLLRKLTQKGRPLEEPLTLVRRSIDAYLRGLFYNIWVGPKNDGVWHVLEDPTRLEGDSREKCERMLRELERDFREGHQEARDPIQAASVSDGRPFRSAGGFLRTYASNEPFLCEVVNGLNVVGTSLSKTETMKMLRVVQSLAGYLVAWGESIYRRGIASSEYGKHNAGIVDILFAVYLGAVDRFVTNDRKQYETLRLVKRMYAPNCEVLMFDSFKKRILSGVGP